jgi:LysM repeat protein
MGQLENGDDKDFVLSNSYQDSDALGSSEDLYRGSGSNASGEQAFKHIYIAIGGFLILILLTERLDQLEANMTARINSIANQLNTAPAKPVAEAATPAPDLKKETKTKIHTVKQGDTLYRISRRYNLSVEQLRQYNQLDQKASIYPGQELKVSSPK